VRGGGNNKIKKAGTPVPARSHATSIKQEKEQYNDTLVF